MKNDIVISELDKRADALNDLSDRIWGYAETAFVEFKSADAICDFLEKEGFKVEKNVADIATAFTCTYGSGKPVIGILGEYDALFGLEQESGVAEKKCVHPEAPGHGCGHNLLGTASVGAAIAVKEYLQKTGKPGTVIFFGTPGEEGGSGKAFMARDGVFDSLDAAITWHPGSTNNVRSASSLANVQAKFRFKGAPAHAAAAPHKGRSALDAAELMNVGVNFMREHVRSDARIHYSFTNAGGKSPNVVQAETEMIYLVRSPRLAEAKKMYEWVCDIARGAALMTQTKVEIEFMKGASNVVPNRVLEEDLYNNMVAVGLPEITDEDRATAQKFYDTCPADLTAEEDSMLAMGVSSLKAFRENVNVPIMEYILPFAENITQGTGSTDVGDVSWLCPTAQLNTACWAFKTPAHSWQAVAQNKLPLAHKMTLYAAKVMACSAIDILNDPEMLEKAKAEFKDRVGNGYDCPIPKGIKPQPIK